VVDRVGRRRVQDLGPDEYVEFTRGTNSVIRKDVPRNPRAVDGEGEPG
jgi:hypothetical protein